MPDGDHEPHVEERQDRPGQQLPDDQLGVGDGTDHHLLGGVQVSLPDDRDGRLLHAHDHEDHGHQAGDEEDRRTAAQG
jgi:hypothetical protein